ncbi:unnamed protein product [Brassica rapa subsp. trilocularis]
MAMCWITSLPEDVIIECVARVPRRYYPSLSLVSKFFRSLIGSPQLYARRSLLDRTECCLYVTIYSHDDDYDRLYTLRQKINSSGDYCLVPIPSLPPMPSSGSYVAVGSKIYVMGGSCFEVSSNALTLIDCPLHTANHHLPNMPRAVASSVSGYINEKIYVIGGCRSRFPVFSEGPMDVMVFDVKSETWESKTRPDNLVFDWYSNSAVTWDDKIYFRVLKHGFVYDPSQDKMEKDDVLKSYHWVGSECVIEGVLYYYSTASKILRSYDLKERSWKRVKGEIGLSGTTCARTVTYDKKVVVIFEKDIDRNKVELWCAEIKLERDEQGEICARLDWCGCVFEGHSRLMNCLVLKLISAASLISCLLIVESVCFISVFLISTFLRLSVYGSGLRPGFGENPSRNGEDAYINLWEIKSPTPLRERFSCV